MTATRSGAACRWAAAACVLLLGLAGCAGMSEREQRMLSGGAIGAGAGAAAGALVGGSAAAGALLGGGVGALGGYLWGDIGPQKSRAAATPARAGPDTGEIEGDTLVRDIQGELARLGYAPGPIDGIYGPKTRAAIIRYQRDQGLAADGRPSGLLRHRLQRTGDMQRAAKQ